MKNFDRRQFIKSSATLGACAPIAATLLHGSTALASHHEKKGDKKKAGKKAMKKGGGAPLIDPNDAQAKALGYHVDSDAVDVAKYPKRKKPKDQYCYNCIQYAKAKKAAKKPVSQTGQDLCQLFAAKKVEVPAKAWCNVWVLG